MSAIQYPYLPEGKTILYVGENNEFMAAAKEFARANNTVKHIGAVVVVEDGSIIGRGSNGAGFHKDKGCVREQQNVPTGTRYDLCEGCGYQYHSEASAIRDAEARGEDTHGADLYLWGHWWACARCWNAIIEAGIENVYFLEGSERLFNKNNPRNIIGRQFE